jgi:hypothetical protein
MESNCDDARRYFVVDRHEVTWRDLTDLARALWPSAPALRDISRDELELISKPRAARKASFAGAFRHLVSSEVRAAVRLDPLLAKLDKSVRSLVARLGPAVENRLRVSIEGHAPVVPGYRGEPLDVRLCAQQLRGVRHSGDAIHRELGYRPLVTFAESLAAFETWYRATHGLNAPGWQLLRQLYE